MSADVQLEHGHVRIANRLLEAILAADFTGTQSRILLALVRLTYGWRRKTVTVSLSELAERANVAFTGGFRRAFQELIANGVVLRLEEGGGPQRATYAIQKDFTQWGHFSVAPSKVAHDWGDRPDAADELLPPSPRPSGDTSLEGHTPTGTDPATLQGHEPCPSGGTVTPANSQSDGTLGQPKDSESKGKTGAESARARESVPVDELLAGTGEATAANLGTLRASLNGQWPDVEAFLRSRKVRAWPAWLTEMAKVIGPGSSCTPADLAGACVDAMALDNPIDGPHALRAFVDKRRRERRKAARGDEDDAPPARSPVGILRPVPASDRAVEQILARVRRQTSNVGVTRFIPRAEVDALGPIVAKAYDRIGGADRFISASEDTKEVVWLKKDFAPIYADVERASSSGANAGATP